MEAPMAEAVFLDRAGAFGFPPIGRLPCNSGQLFVNFHSKILL